MGLSPSERLRRGLPGLGQGGLRGAANGWLFCPEDPAVRGRLTECLEAILNKAQEPPKSKKVQHSNAKNAVLFEAISLVIHHDRWACALSLHPPHAAGCRALASPWGSPFSWASHQASRSQGHSGTRVSVCPAGCVGQGCGEKVCGGRTGWAGGVSRSQQVRPPECHGSTDWVLLASYPAGGCTSLGCVRRVQMSRGQSEKRAKTPPNPRGAWSWHLNTSDLCVPSPPVFTFSTSGLSSRCRPGGFSG